MIKEMIVSSTALETKVAILEDDQLAELYIERNRSRGILGNIYKGRVTKVLPGMQSAFVNIGLEKDAFLYVSDFIEDNEEYDKVLTNAEEQVATVLAEAEVQERQQKRDRRPEKPRWKDRRERENYRPPVTPPGAPDNGSPGEIFALGSETEQLAETILETPQLAVTSPIPALGEIILPPEPVPEAAVPAPEHQSEPVVSEPPEPAALAQVEDLPPRDSASIKESGGESPFTAEDQRTPFTARRRGPAARRKRFTAARHTRHTEHQSIDDMLREGQEILVQVAKEPIGKKGARVTSHVALPGRYLVYMPTVDHIGVSRKIASEAERIRLKDIILKHRNGFPGGVIVRTAAEEHSEEDLVNDLTFLVKIWDDVRMRSEKNSAPAMIHSELNLVQRLLRDQFSFEFAAIRVDDETEYQRIVEFVDKISRISFTA